MTGCHLFGVVAWFAAGAALAAPAATIVSLQGKGEMRPASVQDWRPARVHQGLDNGDFVRTLDLSQMGILFADQTQIRLNQNSQLQIKSAADAALGTATAVRLNAGRAWSQARPQAAPTGAPAVPARLSMETPSATMSIRGTDWEVEVAPDGRTQLAVLSGAVEMANDYGRVEVARGEGAVAEVGKAPVKIVLTQPKERIQWVTAWRVEPARHLRWHGEKTAAALAALAQSTDTLERAGALHDLGRAREARAAFESAGPRPEAELGIAMSLLLLGDVEGARAMKIAPALEGDSRARLVRAALAAAEERLADARAQLESMIVAPGDASALLALSDLRVVEGRLADAIALAGRAVRQFPSSARSQAQLAQLLLLDDRAPEAEQAVAAALAADARNAEARLAEARVARFGGDGRRAQSAYGAAASERPEDERGWLGLGSVAAEREEVAPAREHLDRALRLAPKEASAWGELGTLEAFADRYGPAQVAFEEALKLRPDDYVALTGRGVMRLKQGDREGALEDFLKAGLVEPRYARARLYAGIAYYQLGRFAAAEAEFERAAELDPRDPLPHLFAGLAHTDHFEPAKAVAAARAALERLPYLKSLNQVANNQKGVANVGNALAFWGLKDWAGSYAQAGEYPFWGGSHLFLSDQYEGRFAKNSELFQGFLADPTVFGASPRYQTLIHRPDHYQALTLTAARDRQVKEFVPRVTLNGYANSVTPLAYFVEADRQSADTRSGQAFDYSSRVGSLTAALGWVPMHELRLFGFYNRDDANTKFNDPRFPRLEFSLPTEEYSFGGSYFLSPTSMLHARAGRNKVKGWQDYQQMFGAVPVLGRFDDQEISRDLQLGFRMRLEDRWELAAGAETSKSPESSLLTLRLAGTPPLFADGARIGERTGLGYVSVKRLFSPTAYLQADIVWTDYAKRLDGELLQGGVQTIIGRDFKVRKATPRLGFTFEPLKDHRLRFAYQDWIRPSSPGGLAPVATAGIALEETLLRFGGRLKRAAVKWETEWSPRLYTEVSYDRRRAANLDTYDVTLAENFANLARIRQKSLTEVTDFYAGPANVETSNLFLNSRARVEQLRGAVNAIATGNLSLSAAYAYTSSRITLTTDQFYLPRDTVKLGATWISASRWRLSFEAQWRSQAWTFLSLAAPRPAYWNGAASVYWETQDKRYGVNLFAKELFTPHESAFYGVAASLKF